MWRVRRRRWREGEKERKRERLVGKSTGLLSIYSSIYRKEEQKLVNPFDFIMLSVFN